MKCPSCGLYHPAFYERCVACGVNLKTAWTEKKSDSEVNKPSNSFAEIAEANKQSLHRIRFGLVKDEGPPISPANKGLPEGKIAKQKQIPTTIGIMTACIILLVCAGATVFLLSQGPSNKHLVELGKHQLSLGQYAFAVETLNKAVAMKQDDPQAYLALARAYIGVDQVDQSWDCIVHAQQLGVGVVADPDLASQLANYYRQKGKYEKALDLLRPLANASIPGKKAELADMDAFRGDECIEKGELEQAKRCWEEVRDIKEGSRYPEAQSRLSTIYTRLADLAYNNHEDDKALDYLNKLNEIGENTKNYFLAAEIYERDDKINEAIDQMYKCIKLAPDDHYAQSRLAELLSKRGKELISSGESQSGYSYLEQASSVDPAMKIPAVTLKNTVCKINSLNKRPTLSGEIWNSTNKNVEALSMRVELCDLRNEKILWSNNERMIDEFVPPLPGQDTKSFSFSASSSYSAKEAEVLGFKVYLDGNFYQTYPLNPNALVEKKHTAVKSEGSDEQPSESSEPIKEYSLYQKPKKNIEAPSLPLKNPKTVSEPEKTQLDQQPKETVSPEEKTLKDLEY